MKHGRERDWTMARSLRIEYPGAFYHVTSRGNERKEVFLDGADRERFLSYLDSATVRYGAQVHLYCLMPNHYHLLVETPLGNLSRIMGHINGAYTTYFNLKHQRPGHLFQGRYKAILVDKDEYVRELSRYIHLNPVRAGISATPGDYRWSSYRAYCGLTHSPSWLNRSLILSLFGSRATRAEAEYRGFVECSKVEDHPGPLMNVLAATIMGSKSFVKSVKERFLEEISPDRELPALSRLLPGPSPKAIRKAVEERYPTDRRKARRISIYLCHRYSGCTLAEIGAEFGIGLSAVTQMSRRVAEAVGEDQSLRESVEELISRLQK